MATSVTEITVHLGLSKKEALMLKTLMQNPFNGTEPDENIAWKEFRNSL
jgi:hypothetical protein